MLMDSPALDLLARLLDFDPTTRIDVPTALTHSYVSSYHDESDEPTCPRIFDKWAEVESLQTIGELRAAITREIDEFRAEVRTVIDEEMLEEEEEIIVAPDPTLSPRSGYFELGVSTQNTAIPPPRARDRERESTTPTPMTAFSDDSFGNPLSGRTSRRTSGHRRTPNSFLFASPLGAGMTPMPSQVSLAPDGVGWNGKRSRTASGTGEFASLRPLIRQLSIVGLRDGKVSLGGDGTGMEEEEVPPMLVSPSDAPPSEVCHFDSAESIADTKHDSDTQVRRLGLHSTVVDDAMHFKVTARLCDREILLCMIVSYQQTSHWHQNTKGFHLLPKRRGSRRFQRQEEG